jgi:hypothetical protein
MLKNMRWYFLIIVLGGSLFLSMNGTKRPKDLIWSDMEGYYLYLPAVFIYGDFVKEGILDTNAHTYYPGTNKIFSKYTCGVAMLQLPFFCVTHTLVQLSRATANGKTAHYGRGIAMAGFVYFWLGLLVLYRLGCKYHRPLHVLIALGALVAGTNLYYYTFIQPGMSHVYSFFLFACFLYLHNIIFSTENNAIIIRKWHWLLLALVSGLIILIRPTNVIILLLPLISFLRKPQYFISLIAKSKLLVALSVVLFFAVFIPQICYWKYITGEYVMWSYGNQDFRYWRNPKIFKVLFGAWNGWILYSPMVAMPLIQIIRNLSRKDFYNKIIYNSSACNLYYC